MELIDYICKTDLNNKSEKEKALYLCFYHYKESGETEFSTSLISELFAQCGFSIPNSSRLKSNLTKGKSKTFLIIKGTSNLSIVPITLQELERTIGTFWKDYYSIVSDNELLDENKFCGKRKYIDHLILQINHCYANNCYDASAVLMRRLLEILLILSYQNLRIDDEIKTTDGSGYKMLDSIVKNAISNSTLSLSRIKNELETIRKIGNFSAHGLTYSAGKNDIDSIKLNYRVLLEELYNKAGLI